MTDVPIDDFATALEAMTEDEVFAAMARLEAESETTQGEAREEVLARIALVEAAIGERFPGQALTPYKLWKDSQILS
jgi:hypothetical protein